MRRQIAVLLLLAGTAYAQTAPEKFRFTTDYYYLDLRGEIGRREEIVGTYIRDWNSKQAKWTNVTVANGKGPSGTFEPAAKRDFMEGFSYKLGAVNTSEAEFFKNLPDGAMQERNLVWDTRMFELFGEDQLRNLTPNKPYRFPGPTAVPLAGAGTFQNKDAQLILTGTSKCDRAECAVIDYRAFFNTFELQLPNQKITGRSHYWGQVWVSLKTRRILRATLYEDVLGEFSAPGLATPVPVNVFRIGVLEPVKE